MNVKQRIRKLAPRLFAATLFASILGGCALPGEPPRAVSFYVLTDPGPVQKSPATHPATLLVREMETAPFYQNDNIAFSRSPGTRGQYQYARWTEPTGRRLTWMLRQRLETAGAFAVVAPQGSGVLGELQLNTRLIDFYHDAHGSPGAAILILEADLVQRNNGQLLGRRSFVAQVAAETFDATGAADAMGRAANQVMDEMVTWLAQVSVDANR